MKNKTTNDCLATDTPATHKEYLIIQMRETCKRVQDLEAGVKSERDSQARNYLEALLTEAQNEHKRATQEFLSFLKGNPPAMRSVTHLNLSK